MRCEGKPRGTIRGMSDPAPSELAPHTETLELINAEIAGSLARQSDARTSIDNKAVVLVGYTGAVAGFLATRHPQPVLAVLAYLAFAGAAAFGVWAYAIRAHQDVPAPRELFNDHWQKPKAEALAALAATRVQAFESNAELEYQKATRWRLSLASLIFGMVLMLFAVTSAYW
jgi:hypothetical protein